MWQRRATPSIGKVPTRNADWTARWVEAVKIRKRGAHAMNRDRVATKYHPCTLSCW